MKTQSLKKLGLCLLVPGVALADGSTDENWQVRAAVYGYLPDISGTTQFAGLNGTELTIDADDLVDNTDTAFMTSIEAQKGRVGAALTAAFGHSRQPRSQDDHPVFIDPSTRLPRVRGGCRGDQYHLPRQCSCAASTGSG